MIDCIMITKIGLGVEVKWPVASGKKVAATKLIKKTNTNSRAFHWTDGQWNFRGRTANIISGVFSPPVLRVPTSCCDLKLAFSFEVKILKTPSFLIFESFLLSLLLTISKLKTDPQREENTNWKTKFVSRVVPVTKVLIGRHKESQNDVYRSIEETIKLCTLSEPEQCRQKCWG